MHIYYTLYDELNDYKINKVYPLMGTQLGHTQREEEGREKRERKMITIHE